MTETGIPLKYLLLVGAVGAIVSLQVGASAGAAWGRTVWLFLLTGVAGGSALRRPGTPLKRTALHGLVFGALAVVALWMADGAPWE